MTLKNLQESFVRLIGFKIGNKTSAEEHPSFAIPVNTDGAVTVQTGGAYGMFVDLEGNIKNESDLITRYRDMALQPECEQAIQDITNETIVQDNTKPVVTINLENLEYDESLKEKIRDAFDKILKLLNFNEDAPSIFKRWYVDGRLYYQLLIDNDNPHEGLIDLKYLDPRKIKKVREIKKNFGLNGHEIVEGILEYYLYNERGITAPDANAAVGLKISADSICYVHSGQIDTLRQMVVGHLHKAIKPLNQLRAMEDAHVIYRLSRAAERRVFYIDVGNMPVNKGEQYVKSVMNDFRNKLVYDSQTGEVRDDKKFLSMQEDFFLMRREGGKGTQIETLQSGQNLNQIEDLKHFRENLYKSLHVPVSRLKSDTSFGLGRSAEVARDEYNFTKFIRQIQNQFCHLFKQLLKQELRLTGVIVEEEWIDIRESILFDFQKDQYYSEIRDGEILSGRLGLLEQIEPYVGYGKYFSRQYVKKFILRFTDDEIRQMEKEMEEERDIEREVSIEDHLIDNMDADGEDGNSGSGNPFPNPFQKKKNNLEEK